MKTLKYATIVILVLILTIPVAGQGPGGRGGGTPDAGGIPDDIPDTGELYGDLYVILRDEYGVPMLNEFGCIQPISTVTGSTVIATEDGELLIEVIEGEPFGLPTYTDTAGDLVECELTEDMADWVEGVDFGRLNLGRAPDAVIAHAFDEAIKKMNIATAIDVDPAGRLVLSLPDAETDTVVKTIDAPAENLALYIKMMIDGHWITTDTDPIVIGGRPGDKGPPVGDGPSAEPRPVLTAEAVALLPIEYQGLGDATGSNTDLTSDELQLAASLLAAAADKTGRFTLDKIVYINSVYGINQVGSLSGEIEGKTYFDFSGFGYNRTPLYGGRSSGDCADGWIWVLQPDLDAGGAEILNHYEAQCMEILGYDPEVPDPVNAVRFTNMVEAYTTVLDADGDPLEYDFDSNVRAFAQSADDALRVIEYIHNYKVPEVIYP